MSDNKQHPSTFSLNVHGVASIKCGFVILEHNAVHLDLKTASGHEHSLTIFAEDLRKFLKDLADATTDAQNKMLDAQLAEAEMAYNRAESCAEIEKAATELREKVKDAE